MARENPSFSANPNVEVTEHRPMSPKDQNIKMFRSLLNKMFDRGCAKEQLASFTKRPSAESFGIEADPYNSFLVVFEQIDKHTSLEDRKTILLEEAKRRA